VKRRIKTMVMETTQASSAPMTDETAGRVWSYLDKNGEVSSSRMFRDLGGSRDMLQRAIGWLAREDKISIEISTGTERIRLVR
jgi:hypothetical protein